MTVVGARNIIVEKKIIETKEGKLPKDFDPANLNNLLVDKFFTWDEVRSKFVPLSDDGYVSTQYKDKIMKFPRDVNRKLDVLNGTYSIETVTLKKFKYTDEFRLCLGVAVVTPIIGGVEQPQEGRRCKPFVYSGKT